MLIDQRVGELLVVHLGVEPSRIDGPATLDGDLGLDSLSLTEALLLLEDELAISIPDPVQAKLQTFADLVAVVAAEVDGAGRSAAPGGAPPATSIGPSSPSTSARP